MTSPLRLLTVIGARQPVALMIEAGDAALRRVLVWVLRVWPQVLQWDDGVMCAEHRDAAGYAFGFAAVMYSASSGPPCG